MFKDPEPELATQFDEKPEDVVSEVIELDPISPLSERLSSWIEAIDR